MQGGSVMAAATVEIKVKGRQTHGISVVGVDPIAVATQIHRPADDSRTPFGTC